MRDQTSPSLYLSRKVFSYA